MKEPTSSSTKSSSSRPASSFFADVSADSGSKADTSSSGSSAGASSSAGGEGECVGYMFVGVYGNVKVIEEAFQNFSGYEPVWLRVSS